MVKFITPREVVNGMWAARQRGHGAVTSYLKRVGVPRSTGYRWDEKVRRLVEEGPAELRRLRRERDGLAAQWARACAEREAAAARGRAWERRLILLLAVLGNSDSDIAAALGAAGGPSRSHETIRVVVAAGAARAREVFGRYFAGVGELAAVDEIFLGRSPLLLAVEPSSLLITGLHLAAERSAKAWGEVFAVLGELEGVLADGGSAIAKAAAEAGVAVQRDPWHFLRGPQAVVGRLWGVCETKWQAEHKALAAYEAVREREPKRVTNSARQTYYRAREACNAVLELCTRLEDLMGQVERAFDYLTPEGTPNRADRAERAIARVLCELERLAARVPKKLACHPRRLAKELRPITRAPAFAYLDVLTRQLDALRLEQVGPDRARALGEGVRTTLAWRAQHKEPLAWLAQAADGSLADAVELTVLRAVDRALRASSYVECVNARVRPVQVARKRLSEDFIYLLAVYHNMKPFGRGSVREGRTPAQLAGIKVPTNDWIELLDRCACDAQAGLTAEQLGQRADQVA
jgi:hypothetical protein